MARKTETVAIGGNTFQITALGTVRGKGLWDRLARAIGANVSDVASSAGKGMERQAIAALRALADVPQDLLDDLDEAFAGSCKVQKGGVFLELGSSRIEGGVFDQAFEGAYDSLMEWRIACLKVNFAGFLAKLAASAAAKTAEKTPSQ